MGQIFHCLIDHESPPHRVDPAFQSDLSPFVKRMFGGLVVRQYIAMCLAMADRSFTGKYVHHAVLLILPEPGSL